MPRGPCTSGVRALERCDRIKYWHYNLALFVDAGAETPVHYGTVCEYARGHYGNILRQIVTTPTLRLLESLNDLLSRHAIPRHHQLADISSGGLGLGGPVPFDVGAH